MFHLDLKLRGDTLSEYNETQPFDPYIWRQTILRLDESPSALKLPLVPSFSPLCKLYHSFLLFQRNLPLREKCPFSEFL